MTTEISEVEILARQIVDRVLSVYREDYIERMAREEPDSLLGLVKRLERALAETGQQPSVT